ncbi:MAG: hypothetical protein EZS28_025328 [Streblomastix strix]|uniref:Uncharacterized protein n=1 Tax=Streblomastix strix TaxID=222440 RepID=A0A5J4V9G8_9EUKA|nr:MAG: hypothetical protein EZS28_025328 [Streblomastix strix]
MIDINTPEIELSEENDVFQNGLDQPKVNSRSLDIVQDKRVTIKQQTLDPFTAVLRGVFIKSQMPSEVPEDWKVRGALSLIKFDYCAQKFWVARSRLKQKVPHDTYEDLFTGNTLDLLRTLANSPILEICEIIGQIALPNSFNFKVPMYSFETGIDISSETNFVSICGNSTRLFTVFSKIPIYDAVDILIQILDVVLGTIFNTPHLETSSFLNSTKQQQKQLGEKNSRYSSSSHQSQSPSISLSPRSNKSFGSRSLVYTSILTPSMGRSSLITSPGSARSQFLTPLMQASAESCPQAPLTNQLLRSLSQYIKIISNHSIGQQPWKGTQRILSEQTYLPSRRSQLRKGIYEADLDDEGEDILELWKELSTPQLERKLSNKDFQQGISNKDLPELKQKSSGNRSSPRRSNSRNVKNNENTNIIKVKRTRSQANAEVSNSAKGKRKYQSSSQKPKENERQEIK